MNVYGWVAVLVIVGLALWKFASMIKAGVAKKHAEAEAKNHADINVLGEQIDKERNEANENIDKIEPDNVTDHLNGLFRDPDKTDK